MALGLFGKLPARRDFVTVGVARPFLTLWEEWMEAGLRASQEEIGDNWPLDYEETPAWRFWLGPSLSGEPMLGALVPSCDRVGRNYPLTLVAMGDFAPPDQDACEDWFAMVEAFLIGARQGIRDYQEILDELQQLALPPVATPRLAEGIKTHSVGFTATWNSGEDARAALTALATAAHPRLLGPVSLWWTKGSSDRKPQAYLLTGGMPEPSFFTALIAKPAVLEG